VVSDVQGEVLHVAGIVLAVVEHRIEIRFEPDINLAATRRALGHDTALLPERAVILLERPMEVVPPVFVDAVRCISATDEVPDAESFPRSVQFVLPELLCFVKDRKETVLLLFPEQPEREPDPRRDTGFFPADPVEHQREDDQPQVGLRLAAPSREPQHLGVVVLRRRHSWILAFDDAAEIRDDEDDLEQVPVLYVGLLTFERLVHQEEGPLCILHFVKHADTGSEIL